MTPSLEIARVDLLRTLRERGSLFFVFALPLILIVALGAVFGGFGSTRLGFANVDGGPLGAELARLVEDGELAVDVRERDSLDALRSGVESAELAAALLVPAGYEAALRDGATAELVLVERGGSLGAAVRPAVEAAVARQSALVRAARLARDETGLAFDAALDLARRVEAARPGLGVIVTAVGTSDLPAAAGPFALGAQSQLVLFMFLTSMTAATQLILTRQLGVSRRMLATPTPLRSILLGELLARFAVAMMQGLFIVVASSLLFGVAWGDLPAASAVIVLFALVGTGVAMIVGVVASNADQAAAVGVFAGLLLGALGGAMIPAEVFPAPIATISRLTPHAWALDALRDVALRGAGIGDILLPVAVLAAMAIALVALGTLGLRRALTRG